jgi:hypothetical protein
LRNRASNQRTAAQNGQRQNQKNDNPMTMNEH